MTDPNPPRPLDDDGREEQSQRMFPIQNGPDVPWDVMVPFDKQCKRNHGGQDLEHIAKRGGLGVTEAIAVLLGVDYFEYWDKDGRYRKEDHPKHVRQLQAIVEERWVNPPLRQRIKFLEAENATLRTQRDDFETMYLNVAGRVERLEKELADARAALVRTDDHAVAAAKERDKAIRELDTARAELVTLREEAAESSMGDI